MPFDQKRINGPEISFSYKDYIASSDDAKIKLDGMRSDGRKTNEHRKFALQLHTISKAKGSCYMENGSTKIICAVFELREIPRISKYADKGQLHCDFKYAPFSRTNRKSVSEGDEKLIVSNIKSALESTVCLHEFPNYQVDVFILVLEDDGAVLSTSITAAGLAFIDASIPCFDICSSSTVAIINNRFVVDPTSAEEETVDKTTGEITNHGTVTVSSLISIEQISQIVFKGFVDAQFLKEATRKLIDINKTHALYLKKVLSQKIICDHNES